MEDMDKLKVYIASAPVSGAIAVTLLAGFLIEINRFFPDLLVF